MPRFEVKVQKVTEETCTLEFDAPNEDVAGERANEIVAALGNGHKLPHTKDEPDWELEDTTYDVMEINEFEDDSDEDEDEDEDLDEEDEDEDEELEDDE